MTELKKLEKQIVKANRRLERLQAEYRRQTGYIYDVPYGLEVRDDRFQAEEMAKYDWDFADENLRDEDLPGYDLSCESPF